MEVVKIEKEYAYIYSVAFHVKPGRRVHTFWFTDRKMTENFFESVRSYPKNTTHYGGAALAAASGSGDVREGAYELGYSAPVFAAVRRARKKKKEAMRHWLI